MSIASRIWLGTIATASVLVALYSLRFVLAAFDIWLAIGSTIRQVVETVPLLALTHMILAPVALLLGPFQFWSGFRRKRPAIHRLCGRVYVAACIVSGLAALATAPYASGGPVAGFGFGLLAVLWIASTGGAWYAATQKNFVLHRRLMMYSFAMTFAAVTLRLQIPAGIIFFGFSGYTPLSVWLAYTAWIPNVIVVWCYLLYESKTRRQGAA